MCKEHALALMRVFYAWFQSYGPSPTRLAANQSVPVPGILRPGIGIPRNEIGERPSIVRERPFQNRLHKLANVGFLGYSRACHIQDVELFELPSPRYKIRNDVCHVQGMALRSGLWAGWRSTSCGISSSR